MVESSCVEAEPSISSASKTQEEQKKAKEELKKKLKDFSKRPKIKGAKMPKNKLLCKIYEGGVSDHDSESENENSC